MSSQFERALPAYLGGKRRLAPLIFAELAQVVPSKTWSNLTFIDPFCGGGAVSLHAKARGFRVVSSDVAERAVVVARALIANSHSRLCEEDVRDLFHKPEGEYAHVASRYSPAVFEAAQAAWLDRALARANGRSEPVRSLLLLLIVKLAMRCQPMSMLRGTDARAAATGDFDRVSPRRLGHYLKARDLFTPGRVWAIAQEVNAGVFGGAGIASKAEVVQVMQMTAGDVVYLDPPYAGTTRYEQEYRVLDEMLGDSAPAGDPPELDEVLRSASSVPVLLLSYGGPQSNLSELTALVERHWRVHRALSIPYRHLASIASEEKNANNKEHLIIACR